MDFERYYIDNGFEYACRKTAMMGWRYQFNKIASKIKRHLFR